MKTNKKPTLWFVVFAVAICFIGAITMLINEIQARSIEKYLGEYTNSDLDTMKEIYTILETVQPREQEFLNYLEGNLSDKKAICALPYDTPTKEQGCMDCSVQIYHDAAGKAHLIEINSTFVEPLFQEQSVEYYAYMDINTANTELIPVILAARQRIIDQSSWVDDSLDGWVEDEDGTIIEIVPHFHEVFPDDWEIPSYSPEFTEG